MALLLALGTLAVVSLSLPACNKTPAGPQGSSDLPYAGTGDRRNEVTVYFSKTQGSQSIVEDVARPLPAQGPEPLKVALSELLRGPTAEEKARGFYSEIPKGTKLLGLTYGNDTVTVNLSKHFEEGGGSTGMTQRLDELKRTVYAVDSRHKLEVAIEGKPLLVLGGEGLEVPPTLERTPQ